MECFYSILGVDSTATQEEIKQAYRRKAQQTHPDKEGGDEELFKKVTEAYETLGYEPSRKTYDEFGNNQVLSALTSLFMSMIDKCDVDHTDLVAMCKSQINAAQNAHKHTKADIAYRIKKLQNVAARIRSNTGGSSPIEGAILAEVCNLEMQSKHVDYTLQIGEKMLKALDNHTYDFEAQPNLSWHRTMNYGGFGSTSTSSV